jgi:hypothetical protein
MESLFAARLNRLLQQNRPTMEVAPSNTVKRKGRPKAAPNSNMIVLDRAAINAGIAFRRQATKPMPREAEKQHRPG